MTDSANKEVQGKQQAPPDFDDWREPLLTSLRDCGVQPAPRWWVLRYIVAFLAMTATVIIARILGWIVGESLRNAPEIVVFFGYGLLFVFLVAVLARIRNYFLRQAWQSSARSAEDELSKLGSRRPILYLRSFALDQKTERRSWLERFLGTRPFPNAEEQLTHLLRKLGPVIAIGRPGEKLPKLGAARFYVAHDRWQEKVSDVRNASQFVVWATGVTEGLKWEISHLAETMNPRRLLLWAHPHLLGINAYQREEEWKKFREALGSVFPKPLPEKLGDARFFVFDSDWTPMPVLPELSDVFTNPQQSALTRAMRLLQNGLSDPVASRPRSLPADLSTQDFGAVIGAKEASIHWRLVAAFGGALLLSLLLSAVYHGWFVGYVGMDSSVVVRDVLRAAVYAIVQTGAAVIAFRFIRISMVSVLAAAALSSLVMLMYDGLPGPIGDRSWMHAIIAGIVIPFFARLLFFGSLTWSIARITPLFWALAIGYYLASLLSSCLRHASYVFLDDFNFFSMRDFILNEQLPLVMEALLFASVYSILIKTLPLSWGNSNASELRQIPPGNG